MVPGLCIWLALLPAPASAHVPGLPAEAMAALTLGLRLPFLYPEALLPLLVLGLALAGGHRPLIAGLAGLGAGLLGADLLGDAATALSLGAGALAGAVLALKGPPLPGILRHGIGFVLPALIMAALYHGGSASAPALMAFGSMGVLAVTALLIAEIAELLLTRLPGPIPGLALRIAASWLAAILILMLAFVLAGPAPSGAGA